MNALEKEIVKTVIERLNISVTKSWNSGDLEDWYNYAVRMQTDIRYSISILNTLHNTDSTEVNTE